jgi:hypothetical protein
LPFAGNHAPRVVDDDDDDDGGVKRAMA